MKIQNYEAKYFEDILVLFDKNTPQYFDHNERKDLESYLLNETEDYFVGIEKDKVVIAGGINYETDWAIISWDMVEPNQQGKGFGSELTQFRIQFVRKKGFQKIKVRTSQHTFRFYQKMGFELVQIKRDYWADGFDLYEMVITSN